MFTRVKVWSKENKLLLLFFVCALIIRLACILTADTGKLATYAIGADGSDYVNEALNIAHGHGFSRSTQAPYLPDMIRTPVYPLFLAIVYILFNSFYASLFIKAIISASIPVIAILCTKLITNKKSVLIAVGVLFTLEPHMVYYTIFFTSETLFVPLFCLFVYVFARWIRYGALQHIIWAGIALGLATLTRPISILIPVLCVAIGIFVYKQEKQKRRLIHMGVLIGVFFAILSPWMIRNYIHFNTFSISTVGWFNVYTRFATDITATHDKTDFYTAYYKNLNALSTKGYIAHPPPVSEREIQHGEFMPILKKESFEIIKRYPKEFIRVGTLATITVLTHDNTLNMLETAWNVDSARPPFSPTLHTAQYGVIPTIKALWPYIHGTYIIPYIGRTIWLTITICALFGVWYGIKNSSLRPLTIFFAAIVIYFVIFTLNASPQIDGRYRTQFLMCLIMLCVIAYEHISQKIQHNVISHT